MFHDTQLESIGTLVTMSRGRLGPALVMYCGVTSQSLPGAVPVGLGAKTGAL